MTGTLTKPFSQILKYRSILAGVTRVEFGKRYSGSVLGKLWVVLYPALLLAMYLFVYAVVFRMQFATGSRTDYVIYVFCGLIPCIGFMEAITSGAVAIRQNIHLIKNVMLPMELIPVRYVLMSLISEVIGLMLLVAIMAFNGSLAWGLLMLPVVVLLHGMMLSGFVWFIAPLAVALPDISYFVNLLVLFLMFVSPIGFRPDMVPGIFRLALYLNPLFYTTQVFRGTLIAGHPLPVHLAVLYLIISLGAFAIGGAFFSRFKSVMADYE